MADGSRLAKPPRRVRKRGEPLVSVHFCCNHAEDGAWAGKLFALNIPDEVDLHGPARSLAMRRGTDEVLFRRAAYPCIGWSTWVGNWCWDATKMRLSIARRLVAAALDAGFTVESNALDGPFADLVVEPRPSCFRRETRRKPTVEQQPIIEPQQQLFRRDT